MPRLKELAPIVPVVVVSIALTIGMLTTDHDWGDDFAAYIMQAISVLHGTERREVARAAFSVQESSRYFGPIAAPWGFPLALAPVYLACGGLNIWCLKLVNVPFFALFVVAFFLFLRPRLPPVVALLLASVCAVSPVLLAFQNNVLSDAAFLGFSTLSIVLIDRVIVRARRPEGSPGGNLAIGLAVFLAFFVRANGLLLIPALFVTQAALGLRAGESITPWRTRAALALAPYGLFALLALGTVAIFPTAGVSDLSHYRALTLGRLSDNASTYVILPSVFFWPMPFYELFYGALIPFLACGLVWYSRDEPHVVVYCVLTVLLFLVWPEQQGLRYLFPVLPFFVYWCYRGMEANAFGLTERYRGAGDWLTRGVWTAVLLSFLWASIRLAAHHPASPGGPFDAASAEMFESIRKNASPDDVVIFDKPRLMRLMTDRNALLIDRCDHLSRGRYVVVRKAGGASAQIPPERVATCDPALDLTPILDNVQYVVYRIALKPRPL